MKTATAAAKESSERQSARFEGVDATLSAGVANEIEIDFMPSHSKHSSDGHLPRRVNNNAPLAALTFNSLFPPHTHPGRGHLGVSRGRGNRQGAQPMTMYRNSSI